MARAHHVNVKRKSSGEKVVPEYNAQEQATLRMADAFDSILGAVAMRSEDKAAVTAVIVEARELVHESFVKRTTGEAVTLFPGEGDATLGGGNGPDGIN